MPRFPGFAGSGHDRNSVSSACSVGSDRRFTKQTPPYAKDRITEVVDARCLRATRLGARLATDPPRIHAHFARVNRLERGVFR